MPFTAHRSHLAYRRWTLRLALFVLAALVAALAVKAYLVVQRAQELRAGVEQVAALAAQPALAEGDAALLAELGPAVARTRRDAAALRAEAAPLLPLADNLGWLPHYGPTLRAARPLLTAAAELSAAADEGFTALAPVLAARDSGRPLGPTVANELAAAHPRLVAARAALSRGTDAFEQVPVDALVEPLRPPLARLAALLPLADDAADLALALPALLGVDGSRSYLVLAQNPDELRPTGGLITAAGTLTIEDGLITSAVITDSGALDDPERYAYPMPPPALQRYMGMELWLFRDANWSPDFPTAARQAMALYSLSHPTPLEGAIALDPAAIQLLLAATGPVTLPGSSQPIDATNVVAAMRDGAPPMPGDTTPWAVRRKAFLPPLTRALLDRLASAARTDSRAVLEALRQALDERHLQVFLADRDAAAVFARHGWDGAVRPGSADFLMAVDANIGYNKSNTHIRRSMHYAVDLRDPGVPSAELTLRYTHQLDQDVPCEQARGYLAVWQIGSYDEWTAGCYFNYLRVLVPGASRLISATAEAVPGAWMDSGVGDDGTTLLEPAENGTAALQTLLVVPPGAERERTFRYSLPPAVVQRAGDLLRYRLVVQQQAGAPASPLAVDVQLPDGATLVSSSLPPARNEGAVLHFAFDPARERVLNLVFSDVP
jgi:hypothetical protein